MPHHMNGDGMEAISDCSSFDEVIKRVYGENIFVSGNKKCYNCNVES